MLVGIVVATMLVNSLPLGARSTSRATMTLPPTVTADPARPPAPSTTHAGSARPAVTRPVVQFSQSPTDGEITAARVFAEPLLPVGPTELNENRALAKALKAYLDAKRPENTTPLDSFLVAYPRSAWRASLIANLGAVLIGTGHLSRALQAWDDAWSLTKNATVGPAKAVADYALGEWLDVRTRLGHVEQASERLTAIDGRHSTGPLTAKMRLARDRVALMRYDASQQVSPGLFALAAAMDPEGRIAAADWRQAREKERQSRSSSLLGLRNLARTLQIPLTIVTPRRGAAPTVPAIVQWRAGHVAAVVQQDGDRFLVRDAQAWRGRWISSRALQDESTGIYLVHTSMSAGNWIPITGTAATALAAQGWPSGCPRGAPDKDDPCLKQPPPKEPNPAEPQPPDTRPEDGTSSCGDDTDVSGMLRYSLHPVTTGLRLHDMPVGSRPPIGPDSRLLLRYNQDDQRQPTTFFYSNFGPKWTAGWVSFVYEFMTGDDVDVYLRGSGRESYEFRDANGVYNRHWRSRAVLVRTSADPIRYERRLPDGSIEVFAQPDGPARIGRRVFATEFIDPQGQRLQLAWDNALRLATVTDALGLVTTLSYDNPADPLKITKVIDPFGRQATFEYDDVGRLVAVTDAIGMTSRVSYDRDDLIGSLTTPYGTTAFRRESSVEAPLIRWVEATDPLGGTERIEYRFDAVPGIPAAAPTSEVPAGVFVSNEFLDRYNTYYWSKRAMALYPRQYDKAVITHWLFGNSGRSTDPLPAVSVPHSIKRPLQSRVWYRYQGQADTSSGASAVGEGATPSVTARVGDDGLTEVRRRTFSPQGYPTSQTDPLGRRISFVYAPNGVDLLEVRQTTDTANELLTSYGGYNSLHVPQSITDPSGHTTTFTYNTRGQTLTATNAKNETTTYTYGSQGLLQQIEGPVAGATVTFTYDSYGRVRTAARADGYAITVDYDLFDRPVRTTYPDGTFVGVTYDRLDAASFLDRAGRRTYVSRDAERRVQSVRDGAGRVSRFQWCACGSLDAVVDQRGQATTLERDLQGRIVRRVRADGQTATLFTYWPMTGRLKTVTDPKGQVETSTYFADGTLASVAYSGATSWTPPVSYTYDAQYRRLATVTDGAGVTNYTYHPTGVIGAGLVAAIDGPVADDTITVTYDELYRVVAESVNGSANAVSYTYDGLGRRTSETNLLGTFTFAYAGASARLQQVTYPTGQTTSLSYFDNVGDVRLKTLHHKKPSGSTLTRFDYQYDSAGRLVSQREELDDATASVWDYSYDNADQLLRARRRLDGNPATLLKRYAYTYDAAGNRLFEQDDDAVTGWVYDSRNRLVSQSGGGVLHFSGTTNEPAAVLVQGQAAELSPLNVFDRAVPVSVGANVVTITATDPSGNSANVTVRVDVSPNDKTFTYDLNGNLLTDGARAFVWDARNRLVSASAGSERWEFAYDGKDRRYETRHYSGAVLVDDERAIWCGDKVCEVRDGTSGAIKERLYAHGAVAANASRYFVFDHIDSLVAVTDASGNLIARASYSPFGVPQMPATERAAGFADMTPLAGVGLALAWHRAYDPTLARWLSEDPAGDGLNVSSYVGNNPVGFVDSLGLSRWKPVPGHPGWEVRNDDSAGGGDPPHDHYRYRDREYGRRVYEDGTQRPHKENKKGLVDRDVPEDVIDDAPRNPYFPRDEGNNEGGGQQRREATWEDRAAMGAWGTNAYPDAYNQERRKCTGPGCPSVIAPVVGAAGAGLVVLYIVWKTAETCACTATAGPPGGAVCLATPP